MALSARSSAAARPSPLFRATTPMEMVKVMVPCSLGTSIFASIRRRRSAALKTETDPSGGQADVTWRDGSYTAPWPAGLPLADGATYQLEFAVTGKTQRLSIHQLPGDLDSDVSRAVWMHAKGCTAQAKALLGTLS